MLYFIKKSGFVYLYLLFGLILGFSIMALGEDQVVLRLILSIVNILVFGLVIGILFFKEGQEAVKVRHNNDLKREQIVLTGEDIPLKRAEEYAPYKGFTFGLIGCIPLVVCLIIHLLLVLIGGEALKGAGAVAGIIYMLFFTPVISVTVANAYTYFILLYVFVALPLSTGIPYLLGARKIINQYKAIERQQMEIYGEKG